MSELQEQLKNLKNELLSRRSISEHQSERLIKEADSLEQEIKEATGRKKRKLQKRYNTVVDEQNYAVDRIEAIDALITRIGNTNSREEVVEILKELDDLDAYLNKSMKKPIFTKKRVIAGVSAVALTIAIGLGVNAIKNHNENTNKNESNTKDTPTEENNNDNNLKQTPARKEDALSLAEINKIYGKEIVDEVLNAYEGILTKYGQNVDAPTIRVDVADEELASEVIEKYGEEKVNNIITAYENGLISLDNVDEQTNADLNTNTTQSNTGTFTDINEEAQLLERVNGVIVPAYDALAPQYGVDEEYAKDMFNHFNGGIVNEASRESCLDVIRTSEVLFNNEYLYACDMRNKGESLREESNVTIDYGIFFLDGSKAQKLASQISEYRRIIITSPNSKEAEQASKDFTELFMNSWYLQGNNGVISAYALKTAGQAAFIDKLFLNTADLVQANKSEEHEVTVTNPLTGEEITLTYLVEEVNRANCEGELIAENGDVIKGYMDKFSADMNGMLVEAISNKNIASENFTFGLNYNK